MWLLEEKNQATISEQLLGISGGTTLQDKWERLLVEEAGWVRMEPEEIRKAFCFDAWGRRLNLDFKTNLVAKGASASLLSNTFDVVIWSSGPNGTNELGNGDDIDIVFTLSAANK